MEPITKLDAARRQLDCAIRLFFNCDDSLSVQTLAWAAFKILFDIYPHHRSDGFTHDMNSIVEQIGWKRFAKTPNFLKHADRDPLDIMGSHDFEATVSQIGMAVVLYSRIAARYTAEMRAFDDYMHAMNPDEFNVKPEADPEVEKTYRQSLEMVRKEPFESNAVIGRTLIEVYRANPEHPRLQPFEVKPHKKP